MELNSQNFGQPLQSFGNTAPPHHYHGFALMHPISEFVFVDNHRLFSEYRLLRVGQ